MVAESTAPVGILVSEEVARSDGKQLLAICAEIGLPAELVVNRVGQPLPPAALDRIGFALLSVDVIGLSSKTALAPELAAFMETLRCALNLRWLQVPSAGMDRPFYAELRDRGARLTSATGANAKAVAQTALAGVLALARGIPMWLDAQRAHRWQPLRGSLMPRQLEGEHAVVIGTGPIGQDIGRLLKAFELRVTGVRRSPAPGPSFDRVVGFGDLERAAAEADWIVIACPLTEVTRNLVDAKLLARVRSGARLVNIARGEIVDELALVEALRKGALGGAYLDVFAIEPLPESSPLWDMPNVLISAHSAGNSTAHQRGVIELFKNNLHRIAAGQSLINEWRADLSK
jgi:phosphoglycerate dehydrogenase-like enzyme